MWIFGQKYGPINSIVLSRSAESDNVYIRDEESVQEDGLCEVKIVDNQIMNFNNRSDYLQGLLTALDGLYYYINDFNSTGILYYEVGDMYYVTIGENAYKCLMLNDEINVTTGIEERIYTDLPEQSQTDYSKADKTDRRINQTYLIVDKQNQRIDSVVSNVTEQNNKISQITQTVDEINSKIQDIADITTYGESDRAYVELTDINQSEPIMIKVHPTSTNISYLYPRENLYPSDTQYMPNRIVRFTRTYEEEGQTLTEDIDYELPDDLLRYSDTVYDEFYLDYDSQTCQITKRCEWAGGVNNIINPADIINYSDIGGISSITYDETETFKVIFDNEDEGNIRVSRTYFKFQSDSITISLQNLVNVNIRMIIYYYNGDTMLGYRDFTGSIATIHNNDINGNIANRWQLYLLFYNVSVNQECRFNLMVNTGTTALPFETFNAIVAPKNQEQVIDYPYPQILLGDGDYSISLKGYDYGYIYVRLMAANIYTTQFYTKVETNTLIQQNVDSINLVVERKLDEEDFTGANIILAVNNDSSSATISADKVSLYGKTIDLTADWIDIQSNNFTVDEHGTMTCQNATVRGKVIVGGDESNPEFIATDGNTNTYIYPLGIYNEYSRFNEYAALMKGGLGIGTYSGSSQSEKCTISSDSLMHKGVYSNTSSSSANVRIDSAGYFYRATGSSKRWKTNITEEIEERLNPQQLYDLPIKQFRYKEGYLSKNDKRYNKNILGFIAEDVQEIYEPATEYDEDGQVEMWNSDVMIPAMLKLIQEQHIEIEQMKKEIEKLKGGK